MYISLWITSNIANDKSDIAGLHNMPAWCFATGLLHPVSFSKNVPYVGNNFGSTWPHIAATPPPPSIGPAVLLTGTNGLGKLGWQVSDVKMPE